MRALIGSALAALSIAVPAHAAKRRHIHWNAAGASIYGGFCGQDETTGYRGAYLPDTPWSFAELGMGTALGGLPNEAKIRLLSPVTKRKTWATKRDIGLGGGPVNGHARRIDLYAPLAQWLVNANCNWTGVILWRK